MPVKVSFQPPPIRPDKNCDQTKRGNNVLAALHPDLHFQSKKPGRHIPLGLSCWSRFITVSFPG